MQAISILAALATASAFAPAQKSPAVAARKAVVVEANVGLYFSTMYAQRPQPQAPAQALARLHASRRERLGRLRRTPAKPE